MQSIPAFLISQAFLYSMLNHLMFNSMLSMLDPQLESPWNASIMHYWKFFLVVDFTPHIQGGIHVLPAHAHTVAVLLTASCLREPWLSLGVVSPDPTPYAQPAFPPATHSPFPLLLPLLVWKGPRFPSRGPAVLSQLSLSLSPPAANRSQHTAHCTASMEIILLSAYSSE